MTVTTRLASVAELGTLLKLPNLDAEDDYALMMLGQASNRVREAANRPTWVAWEGEDPRPTNPPAPGTWAPEGAREVTLWVAMRAFTNPANLSRRTSGPISETYANGVYGLELTEDEQKRLDGMTGRTHGLWALSMAGGMEQERMLTVGVVDSGGFTYPGSRGFHIADNGDWPYGYEP